MNEITNRRKFITLLGSGAIISGSPVLQQPARATQSCKITARIRQFRVNEGTYHHGDIVPARVTVTNTGRCSHRYFIGYGAIDKHGTIYDNDATTGHPLSLRSGETRTTTVRWQVEQDAPPGPYTAGTAVWKESNPNALATRLDQAITENAFAVEDSPTISQKHYRDIREALEALRKPWIGTARTATRRMVTDLRKSLAGLVVPELEIFLPKPADKILQMIEFTEGAFAILRSQRRSLDRTFIRAKWKSIPRQSIKRQYDLMSYDYGAWRDVQDRPFYPLFTVLIHDLLDVERQPSASNIATLHRDADLVDPILNQILDRLNYVDPEKKPTSRSDPHELERTIYLLDVVTQTIRNMPQ